MQAIVKAGVVKKIRLTAVEKRRLDEAHGILHTLGKLCGDVVPSKFLEEYGAVCSRIKERCEGPDENQLEFPESVYSEPAAAGG